MSELLDKKTESQIIKLDFQDQFKPPDELEDESQKTSLRAWWSVIQANSYRPYKERAALYERSLVCIPQCYKLWYNYLDDTLETFKNKCPLSKKYIQINEIFEQALKYMQRMPKIWFMYIEHLKTQKLVKKVREVFDRSLRMLPLTQHEDMWTIYTEWALEQNSVETLKHIANRYYILDPDFKEDVAEYLINKKDFNSACLLYHQLINDEQFAPKKLQSKYQMYLDLCDMIQLYPDQIKSIDCEGVMREGVTKYVDEVGNLWSKLADYYIKTGKFTKARQVYEEGINSIMTARDFNIIYNSYLKFEQEMVNALAMGNEDGEEEVNEDEILQQIDRLEKLVDQRTLMLTECLLRANRHSVQDWLNKINYYEGNVSMTLQVFAEAINTIDPAQAQNGSLADIHIKFAEFYYKNEDLKNTNIILNRATKYSFKSIEDLLKIWQYWIELLIKEGFYSDAIIVVKQALFSKRNRTEFNLFNNLILWQIYIDLELNFGTFNTAKQAYQKMMDIKAITPFILLNFASFLEKNHYYEESFKVYETGISIFVWPGLFDIWVIYINKFIERYGKSKLERTRDLFEKVLRQVPEKQSKIFYLMYAEYEEKYGLLNHAFEIYDRMVVNVDDSDKLDAYNLYIAKIAHFLGITKSRPIFESAIENFRGPELVNIGLRFAQLERKFGEIDRSRAIYIHISQFADPRDDESKLWKVWNDFEVHHGNIDTMKDYIRIKRSVLAKFNLLPMDINKIKQKVDEGTI